MNNAQFRKLLETPRVDRPANPTNNAPSATPTLGSKIRSSMPMTPRSLTTGNSDFARQLAAHRASQQPAKKFRSSAAPKGTKFGEGYTDRAAALRGADDSIEDERMQRLQALEQLAKEGHIDREEYVKQTKLLGGDVKSTHLVKGLDFALLQRVRRGENVMDEDSGSKEGDEAEAPEEDLDGELEKALEKEVVATEKKKERKYDGLVPKPKTRAELLSELKRSRQAAKEAIQPSLGSKFKKIGDLKERIEETEDGLKVKHVIGADGKVKRKVKRSDKEQQTKVRTSPPREARVMGMMPPLPLPGVKAPEEEEEDDDIFADAGDYNPLAALGDDDEEDSDTESPKRQKQEELQPQAKAEPAGPMPPPPRPAVNYFNEPTTDIDSEGYKPPSSASDLLASNPELAAALQRASRLAPAHTKEGDEQEKRRRALVEAHERDSYDLDMGFGGSTNFGDDDEDEGVVSKGGAKKRKRGGGSKKKGDKNSADVVGKIVEQKYGSGR